MDVAKNLYFGYGSNLWVHQMDNRCPEHNLLGAARLRDWRWIINTRGYATIVPSEGDHVYALLYELNAKDEETLDQYEGVPYSYRKEILQVEYLGANGAANNVAALVYVDIDHPEEGPPRTEYVRRMNMGIVDAIEHGIPKEYIDQYLRPFIPEHPTSKPSLSSAVDAGQLFTALNKLSSSSD
ncbi:Butirosin biosynthesis, BtrG-like protein [Mycena amicta]|nr:Butirosin biosynthesis, BtrG-like protein [Mycena amicta]